MAGNAAGIADKGHPGPLLRGRGGRPGSLSGLGTDGAVDTMAPEKEGRPSSQQTEDRRGSIATSTCRRVLQMCAGFAAVFGLIYALGLHLYNTGEGEWMHRILDEAVLAAVKPAGGSLSAAVHAGPPVAGRPSVSLRALEDPVLGLAQQASEHRRHRPGGAALADLATGAVEVEDALSMMRRWSWSRKDGEPGGQPGQGASTRTGASKLSNQTELDRQLALWEGGAREALRAEEAHDTIFNGRRGRPCESHQDCGYGSSLVCVRAPGRRAAAEPGTCQCTVLRSGSATCSEQPPGMPRWCVLDVADRAVMGAAHQNQRQAPRGPNNAAAAAPAARLLAPGSGRDLAARANWETCAVVASSHALLSKRQGPAIDRHTAVIRFNDAPTKGFERHVGSKTTLRVQNVERCGFAESRGEMCLQYTQRHACRNPALRERGSQCTWVKPSRRLLSYVEFYWAAARPPRSSRGALKQLKLSTGFLGIALALHLCGRVDVYGFEFAEEHYFRRQREARTSFADRHSWQLERKCINHLRSNKSLRRLVTFR